MRTIRCVLLVSVAVMMLSACSCPVTKVRQAAARTQRMNTIKLIGIAYHNHIDSLNKAPSQAADIQKFTMGDPAANAALTDGSFTFIYDVTITDMTKQQGASKMVIGYDKQFDPNNVIVLMGDASVQLVTPEEFEKMPKATPAKK